MNHLGITMLWCVAQVTAITLLAGGFYLAMRRRGPALGSVIAISGLAAVGILSLLAISPWPCWWDVAAKAEKTSSKEVVANHETAESVIQNSDGEPSDNENTPTLEKTAEPQPSAATLFWQAMWQEMSHAPTAAEVEKTPWRWQATVAVLLLCLIGAGTIYLLAALWAVRSVIRRSTPIRDAELLKMVDSLRVELGCGRQVAVRESEVVFTAATAGWLRPVILLSREWTTWDEQRRRAVLAHELAHISHGDYLISLLAQIMAAIHFYHPLVHWLVDKLRLEQELAADAIAARVAGGREPYLYSLAEMALRQDERVLGWPARCFLPTRGTFLRRIEMLRDSKRLPDGRSLFTRVAAVSALVFAAVLVAGLRSPAGDSSVANAAPKKKFKPAPRVPFDLTYTGDSDSLVIAVKPAAILSHPGLKPLAKLLSEPGNEYEQAFGVSPDIVEQFITTSPRSLTESRRLGFESIFIQTTKPHQPNKFMQVEFPSGKEFQKSYRGKSYHSGSFTGPGAAIFQPNERTMIFDREENIKRYIDGRAAKKKLLKSKAWKQVTKDHVAIVASSNWFRDQLNINPPGNIPNARMRQSQMRVALGPFSPVWEESDTIALGVSFGEKLTVHSIVYCDDEPGAERVAETWKALITLSRNTLKEARKNLKPERFPPSQRQFAPMQDLYLKVRLELLDNARVTRKKEVVYFETAAKLDEELLIPLAKATAGARVAARSSRSKNNLEQIAIAMHNFHDTFRHFPASAAGKEKPGGGGERYKHPVSWRVLILPFIKQSAIYDKYRFDEPWDSEHNLKLAEKMPDAFRHPNAPKGTNHTSYFALVGDDTAMGKTKGVSFRDITDGTSNTVMIVEARREVIWTKPEDIPYDPKKPLPKLGGYTQDGFHAALCDGSVRGFSHKSDPKLLRLVFNKSDGQIVNWETFPHP